ncbi:lymphocyte antigen 6 complex locus protein G6f-like [Dromiciops gliroides]|uniref:lymphocyte antigen 6 complex locus protein G6f-like n=1 Tax=Dromiciops gliroides TaxID=33562 RepID=UPI001CC79328|nr:lymphocyte antigen 6 complex locus protein G6f-like [Dromiciops gliroides]
MACLLFYFLFLLLPFIPQISSDDILSTYVALRENVELPCPEPPTLYGDETLSWFRSPVSRSNTIEVIRISMTNKHAEAWKTVKEVRLSLLRNNSLWLEEAKEEDAGRYWCSVLGNYVRYQNWRVYELSVIRGSQLSAKTAEGSVCSILVCSVVSAVFLDSVVWLEGKGKVKGRVETFMGKDASLLMVCPAEGTSESRIRRARSIRCTFPQDKGISFNLTAVASPDAPPTRCVVSPTWDIQKILLLLCVLGQGVTILAMGIVLWRRRNHRAQYGDDSTSHFKPETQVYENIHLAIPSPPAPRTM